MSKYLILLAMIFLAGCATTKPPVTSTGLVCTPQMVADLVGARNYVDLCTWMHQNLPYRADKTAADEWKEPDVTLRDGYGDCEDLAQVALEVMRLWGVKDAFLMGVSNVARSNGHVVAFFRDKPEDEWRIFSNDDPTLWHGGATLDSVMRAVGSFMRYGSKLEYQLANSNNENIPKEAEASYGLL